MVHVLSANGIIMVVVTTVDYIVVGICGRVEGTPRVVTITTIVPLSFT